MPGFAAAKEAGQPCPKLGHDGLCMIYADRAEQGFAGCIRFECFGAGQHVVQTLFEGRDWRDDRELLGPMIETFLAMRPVSDLAFLVSRALASGPDTDTTVRLEALQDELAEIAASRETLRESARIAKAQSDVRQVFTALDPDALRNS
ncbi:MAG: hypothetical protein CL954_07350 [Erythrobacteraceae bacterium]|nr:hypothetical protein [Erythrobacteraceae bacterium]